MGKKRERKGPAGTNTAITPPMIAPARPSSLLDTRFIHCGDNLEQLTNLPDRCIDLIYIYPPFNSNRIDEVFWGETKAPPERSSEDRHASTQAYPGARGRPRCLARARVLKKTGGLDYREGSR